jgi:hypothetical protein
MTRPVSRRDCRPHSALLRSLSDRRLLLSGKRLRCWQQLNILQGRYCRAHYRRRGQDWHVRCQPIATSVVVVAVTQDCACFDERGQGRLHRSYGGPCAAATFHAREGRTQLHEADDARRVRVNLRHSGWFGKHLDYGPRNDWSLCPGSETSPRRKQSVSQIRRLDQILLPDCRLSTLW